MNDGPNACRWLSCPECGGEDVRTVFNNGRLRFACDDCHHSSPSKLVGRATFR